MRQNKSNSKELVTIAVVVVLVVIFSIMAYLMNYLTPPETDKCGCPSDEYISKKNVVLIDITDPLPNISKPTLENIFNSASKNVDGFLSWVFNGKKVEKTTFFILSSTMPSEMLPIGSYCQQPPEYAFSISEGNKKVSEQKKKINNEIENSIALVKENNSSTHSHIIEAISHLSNSEYWSKGSTFTLFSDFEERSLACGDFTKNVPNFESLSKECKKWIDIARVNMYTKDNNSEFVFCEIFRDKVKQDGLPKFWQEYAYFVTNNKKSKYGCEK